MFPLQKRAHNRFSIFVLNEGKTNLIYCLFFSVTDGDEKQTKTTLIHIKLRKL